jgi:hypothetical protein
MLSLHYDPQQRYLLEGLNNGTVQVQEWRKTAGQYALHRDKEYHTKAGGQGGDRPTWHVSWQSYLLETLHVHSDGVWEMTVVVVVADRSLLLATCGRVNLSLVTSLMISVSSMAF